ncbi:MAG TPA: outer membrane protein transport protein [Kofleriaceae bacterium]
MRWLALLFVAATAHAGGFGIPEIGVRRTGMGAVIGRPDDPSALYHNPAGLVLDDDWTVYISCGASFLKSSIELAPWDDGRSSQFLGVQPQANGYYAAISPSRAFGVIPMIAVAGRPLPRRFPKLHLGAGVFVGNATGAAFPASAVTRYHLIDGYVVAPQAVIGAAYQVLPTLALGATVGVINIRVHGDQDVYPIVNGMNVSSIFGTAPRLVLDGSAWAPSWSIGAFGAPHPRITWGAAVIGRVDATLHGPVAVTYSSDAPDPGTITGLESTNEMLPWTFQAGANVDVTPHVEVGAEFRYWLYRQFKEQDTNLVGIYYVRSLDSVKDYHDSQEVSGGVRVHDVVPKLDLMAGAQYDHSPAPPDTLTLSSPSFSHVGLHSGVRYTIGRYRIGASYIHYWYFVPTVTDSITSPPTDFRGSGSNNIVTLSVEAKL